MRKRTSNNKKKKKDPFREQLFAGGKKNKMKTPFNKPHLTGKEAHYLYQAVMSGKISGNGMFTQKCHEFFEKRYEFKKVLLTTSCTDALEMAAILLDIQPGDEVIMPSYTFVSTANAFVLRGAKIVFADSRPDHPGIDEDKIEALITLKTKAIVPVHYAGVACDMDKIMDIANRHDLLVVEDAAQAIDSYYTGTDGVKRPLGSIGHLGTFSFHETKNIQCGEGGMLAINDEKFISRARWTNTAGWILVHHFFLPRSSLPFYGPSWKIWIIFKTEDKKSGKPTEMV
jgi:dTDP-4-amino-4,6-dideoxygalactose transaminase